MVARRKFNGKQVFRIMQAHRYNVMGVVMDIRILVVEDSELTRRMIRAVLQTRDWAVCGEAENGLAGVEQSQSVRPDVVVLDPAMPGTNGVEASARMSILDPPGPPI